MAPDSDDNDLPDGMPVLKQLLDQSAVDDDDDAEIADPVYGDGDAAGDDEEELSDCVVVIAGKLCGAESVASVTMTARDAQDRIVRLVMEPRCRAHLFEAPALFLPDEAQSLFPAPVEEG